MSDDLDPIRVDKALRAVVAWLDYDIHKSLECGEGDGEDTYHEYVSMFLEAYRLTPTADVAS